MLGGVCGGFAEYFDVDPGIVRLIFVVLLIFSMGFAILVYIAAWVLIPGAARESPEQTPLTG